MNELHAFGIVVMLLMVYYVGLILHRMRQRHRRTKPHPPLGIVHTLYVLEESERKARLTDVIE